MKYLPHMGMGTHNVYKDDEAGVITIFADIFIYGPRATEALAKDISKDVRDMWNRPNAHVMIGRKTYRTHFSIRGYLTSSPDSWASGNKDHKKVFIKIDEKTDNSMGGISYMDSGVGGANSGFWGTVNVGYKRSSTEAHEMGHGWGLWPGTNDGHPPAHKISGQPGIMYARGTLVDSIYQYNIHAKQGALGGTINPDKRKVLTSDILMLGLNKLVYDKYGRASLGSLTNKIH